MILSMEPMEALRYLPYARRDAVLVTSRNPVRNVASYPDEKVIEARLKEWPHHVILDAEKLARQAGTVRAVNSVILGAASAFLMIPEADCAPCRAVLRAQGPRHRGQEPCRVRHGAGGGKMKRASSVRSQWIASLDFRLWTLDLYCSHDS